MLHEFLVFGGLLFWVIVGVITLVIAAQVHEDRVGGATATLVVFLALVGLFTNTLSVISTIPPIFYVYGFGAYMGAAGLWATVKWRAFYLPKLFDRYEELRSDFLERKSLKEFPADPAVRDEFNSWHDVRILNIGERRMVRYNKGKITTWMLYWPFSLIETFFGDFLHRVFATLYKMVAGLFQRMSDGMASKYSELN